MIMMHQPSTFVYQGEVVGSLRNRHTIALVAQGGVVVLDRAEVLKTLPWLQYFAEHGLDADE